MAKQLKVRMQKRATDYGDWMDSLQHGVLRSSSAIIEKELTVDEDEYNDLCADFLKPNELLKSNRRHMWFDQSGWHCIALLTANSDKVLTIMADGNDYAKYVAVITKSELSTAKNRRNDRLNY